MAKHRHSRKPSTGVAMNAPVKFVEIKQHAAAASKHTHGGKAEGGVGRLRLDRPGRKSGGRVGADTSPLSSASRTSG